MFIIKFSIEDLTIINDALTRMPYGSVVKLIHNINEQLKKQQADEAGEKKDAGNN